MILVFDIVAVINIKVKVIVKNKILLDMLISKLNYIKNKSFVYLLIFVKKFLFFLKNYWEIFK